MDNQLLIVDDSAALRSILEARPAPAELAPPPAGNATLQPTRTSFDVILRDLEAPQVDAASSPRPWIDALDPVVSELG